MTIDESMEETLREMRQAETPEEPEVEEEVVEEPEAPEPEKAEAQQEEPIEEPEPEEQEEPEVPEPEDPSIINPPYSWRAGAKAAWKDLPQEIRQEVMKRETEMKRGVDQMREKASFGDQITQIAQPYMPIIQAEGSTVQDTFSGLMNTAYILRQGAVGQKAQLAVQMAQKYGFLDELRSQLSGENNQLQSVLSPLQQEIMNLKQQLEQREQQTQQSEAQRYQTEVEQFAQEADEDGTLKHPYFDNVRSQMALLIQAANAEGRMMSLEEAYENALWASPETRGVLQSRQAEEASAKRQREAKERAAKAKQADSVNLGKKPSHDSTQPKPTGSVDDTLKETMERIRSASS